MELKTGYSINPFSFLGSQVPVISFPAIQILFIDHITHWLIVHLTFHPRYDIEVRKGSRFEAIFFQMLDFVQKLFQFLSHSVS